MDAKWAMWTLNACKQQEGENTFELPRKLIKSLKNRKFCSTRKMVTDLHFVNYITKTLLH